MDDDKVIPTQRPRIILDAGGLVDETRVTLALYGEDLDPETALNWLQDDYPCIYHALRFGYASEDSETREVFSIVADDV